MSPDIPLGLQWLGGMCENGNDIAALLVISGSLRREVQCPKRRVKCAMCTGPMTP